MEEILDKMNYELVMSLTVEAPVSKVQSVQYNLKWFPSKRSHHRFPMKLGGMLMLQDKEILKT